MTPLRTAAALPPAAHAPAAHGRAEGAAHGRDAYFDNAKFLAVVLVVCGHAWEPLRDGSRTVLAVYATVYAFHMPAFVLVSGYFSRTFDAAPHRIRRLITSVAVPYVLFETAYSLFHRIVGDHPEHRISLLDPWYVAWFLMALFLWRLSTPLWRVLRHPMPVALALAALAAVSPSLGEDLALQRVLQFLPFFVLGLTMKPGHFRLLQRTEARLLAVPVLAATLVTAYLLVPRYGMDWFYHSASAQEMGHSPVTGAVSSVLVFCGSTVVTLAFLALVPRRRTRVSALGAGTLYAYLLHGFLVQYAGYRGWYDAAWLRTPAGAVAVTLLAAGLATLLCSPPVRRCFRAAVEPRLPGAFDGRTATGGPE